MSFFGACKFPAEKKEKRIRKNIKLFKLWGRKFHLLKYMKCFQGRFLAQKVPS